METRSNHVLVGAVVLILLAVTALFAVWLARLNATVSKEYDIFFSQAVDGLAKGSSVAFAGVPSGQVKSISVYEPDPSLVRVRISVNNSTPVLKGTTAAIQGVGFTGVSQIQLDGAIKGAPPIECPTENFKRACPFGKPVIPARQAGLGALLATAPKLLEKLTDVADKLSTLLSKDNQRSITGILDNTNRLTKALADRGPEIAASLTELKQTLHQTTIAAQKVGALADSTNQVMTSELKPTFKNLNATIASAKKSMDTLDTTIQQAKPGVKSFSRETIPQINQLIADLRELSTSLSSIAQKVDQQGATSILSKPKLPDYKPSKKGKN